VVEVVVEVVVGEMLTLETPKVGVLTLEGSVTALVTAVLELGVDALEVGGVTGDAGGFGFVALEDGGVTALALGMPRLVLVGVTGA
jgi:hypothetical protein